MPLPITMFKTIQPNTASATGVGRLLYKEITDWAATASRITDDPCATTATQWVCNMSYDSYNVANFVPAFVYGTTNNLNGSYFAIKTTFTRYQTTPANDKPLNFLPLPATYYSGTLAAQSGKIVYQFPALWFNTGESSTTGGICYASWGFSEYNSGGSSAATQKKLKYLSTDTSTTNSALNFFSANFSGGSEIDTSSNMTPATAPTAAAPNIMRIVSTYSGANTVFLFMKDFNTAFTATATNKVSAAFYSNCVKWNATPPGTVKSPYTYIDIQIKFHYAGSSVASVLGPPMSVMRFIKLFPEGGIFFDPTTKAATSPPGTNPYNLHTALTPTGTYGVCLIELDGATLSSESDSASPTLSLWLMMGTLIESDYNDASSTYPTSAISSVLTYGLPSANGFNIENKYIANATAPFNLANEIAYYGLLGANVANKGGRNGSSYLFFMGSQILFTAVSTNALTAASGAASTPNLLIPYYCPIAIGASAATSFL